MRLHLGDDIREVDWPIGTPVYHCMADEPMRGIVTGYHIRPDSILYAETWHYTIELSATHEPHYGGPADTGKGGPAGEGRT